MVLRPIPKTAWHDIIMNLYSQTKALDIYQTKNIYSYTSVTQIDL